MPKVKPGKETVKFLAIFDHPLMAAFTCGSRIFEAWSLMSEISLGLGAWCLVLFSAFLDFPTPFQNTFAPYG